MKKTITILILVFFGATSNAQDQLGLETTLYSKMMKTVVNTGESTVIDTLTTLGYNKYKRLFFITIGSVIHKYKLEFGTSETFTFSGQECSKVGVVNTNTGIPSNITICPNDGMLFAEGEIKLYFFNSKIPKEPKTKVRSLFRFQNLLDD